MSGESNVGVAPEEAPELNRELIDRLAKFRVLSIPAVARVLGLSARTVRSMIDEGKLPHTRVSTARVGVRQWDLEQHIAKNTHGAVSHP